MQVKLIILFLCVCFLGSIYSQEINNNQTVIENISASNISNNIVNKADFINLNKMLKNKDYLNDGNIKKIQNYSQYLSFEDKKLLYNENKQLLPLCLLWTPLNTFYGIGSWIQGDYLGGAIVSGTMIFGIIGISSSINLPTDNNYQANFKYTTLAISYSLACIGMIFGWVCPWVYVNNSNLILHSSLLYWEF